MNKKQVQMRGVKTEDDIYSLFKIVDKLEKRIATLEKVLASHAKCIGEMREDNFIPIRKNQIESIEKELKNGS